MTAFDKLAIAMMILGVVSIAVAVGMFMGTAAGVMAFGVGTIYLACAFGISAK